MKVSEARALFPETVVLPHDAEEDLDALCHLCETAQIFSPIVGIEQVEKIAWAGRLLPFPESLILEVTGVSPLFGGDDGLVHAMAEFLRSRQLFGCIALADTIGCAWAVANWGLRRPTNATSETDGATDDVPASRVRVVRNSEEVKHLPAEALRLDLKTVEQLSRLGCRTIGEIERLPRSGLASRLGAVLLKRLDQIHGATEETVETHAASEDYQFRQNLEYPTEDFEILSESLKLHCRSLAKKLSASGDGALRLVCRLEQLEAPSVVIQIGFFRPTQDPEHLCNLLCGQLEQQLSREPVCAVQRTVLGATLTAPLVWRQGDLFDEAPGASDSQLAALVDTLSARMGRKRVLSATVRRDSQPELEFAFRPLTGLRRTGTPQDTGRKLSSRLATRRAEPTPTDPLRRPTHLLSPPVEVSIRTKEQPASVDAVANRESQPTDGTTVKRLQFFYQQNWHTVISREGPERLESGWWKGPSARRDYYRFATSDGCWWWVYRDMTNNKWFLHGKFD